MHCDLGWRQREDQPPVTGVDRLVLQHVAEERSVSLGILAVDDDVSAVNHAPSIPSCDGAAQPAVGGGRGFAPPLNGSIVIRMTGPTKNLLVITGPPGSGKTPVLHELVASGFTGVA